MSTAQIVEDSVSEDGIRLITMQLRYQRFIHAEFMTHRVFSRNASSSRAIPVAKMIEQVRTAPAMPIHWGKNQPGMQAREELTGQSRLDAEVCWRAAARRAAEWAEQLAEIGAHKQVANRLLEPFQWISVVVTATEWDNFFELRDHEDAQPEIQALARAMRAAMDASTPVPRRWEDRHQAKGWHLPYVSADERVAHADEPHLLVKLSAARCARVSYLTHDGETPDAGKDLALYNALVGARPIHASPTEHQACVLRRRGDWCKNFRGWKQGRVYVEAGTA